MTCFVPLLLFLLASSSSTTTKTIYLIRHAESEENVRLGRLYNAGRSLKRGKRPSKRDIISGSKFLAKNALGRTDSSLSENGRAQIEEMYSRLKQAEFTQSLDLIAHSPLVRAKDTCYGVLDLSCGCPMVELECLREVNAQETIRRGRQPVKDRIDALYSWLDSEEQASTIALVGHSEYFRVMLGLTKIFDNCDVWKSRYETGHWADLELEHSLNEKVRSN